MEGAEGEGVRIFIGGLGEEASSNDLRRMLESLGAVESVEIIRSKGRSFAYINFLPTSPKSIAKLFSTYNGCVWKGGRLKLEKAKEHYLVRLKREWAEDTSLPAAAAAAAATETGVDVVADNKKELLTEKTPLKIFFPKSRKVKKIPFAGSGKHKYSFRRVPVPSLPKHFCDCEEHSPPVVDAYANANQLDSGVNVEELDMMNSVMNELLGIQNAAGPAPHIQMPNQADSTITPINYEPQLEQDQEDSTSDEDNLIINLVSQGKSRQGSRSDKRNASNYLETQGTLKKQRTNVSSPNSQSRPVCGEENSTFNLKKTSDASLDASKGTLGNQLIQPESGFKQSTPTFSWSQKSSWKKLVGDNTAFNASQSLLKSLPDLGEQFKSDNAPNSPDTDSKNLGNENQKELLDRREAVEGLAEAQPAKPDISFSNSVPQEEISTLNLIETSDAPLDASKVTLPESGFKQSTPTFSLSQNSSWKKLVGDNTAFYASESLPKVVSDLGEQSEPDNAPNSPDTDNKNLGIENHEEVLDKREVMEGLAEAQPAKPDISFGNSGRGSGWLHTCSWTQLTGGNNSGSFSIRQLLPGVNLEEQEPAKQDRMEGYKLPETKHGDTTRGNKSQPKAYAVTQMRLQNAREMKKQNFVVNDASSASVTDTKDSPAAMEGRKEEVAVGETCLFMKNAASLKEWARTKAAISGSRKRTSNEK